MTGFFAATAGARDGTFSFSVPAAPVFTQYPFPGTSDEAIWYPVSS